MSTSIKYKDILYTTGNNISFKRGLITDTDGTTYFAVHVYNSDVNSYNLLYTSLSEREHVVETITRCLGGYLDLDDIDNSRERSSGGGGSTSGIFVGYVNSSVSVPTTRPDGSPLQNEDYVRSNSTTYPFTTKEPNPITFPNKATTKAYYNTGSGTFIVDVGAIQDTSETPVKDKTTESISKNAYFQNQINEEVVKYIKQIKYSFVTATNKWSVTHNLDKYPKVTTFDEINNLIVGAVDYIDENNLEVNFVEPQKGTLVLN